MKVGVMVMVMVIVVLVKKKEEEEVVVVAAAGIQEEPHPCHTPVQNSTLLSTWKPTKPFDKTAIATAPLQQLPVMSA